tara:strand:- start:148 stop:480 length:333 start_codon:yes stop_codon:yes gene_type:complete
MKLLTKEILNQLIDNGQEHNRYSDHMPVVKIFTPDAAATWLLTEVDPTDPDLAFGLCDLGLGFPELGYVRISEIESVRGQLGLKPERDLHFKAKMTLSEYHSDALQRERI